MQKASQAGASTISNMTIATIWDVSVHRSSLSIGTKSCGMQSILRDDLCCIAFATGVKTIRIR